MITIIFQYNFLKDTETSSKYQFSYLQVNSFVKESRLKDWLQVIVTFT